MINDVGSIIGFIPWLINLIKRYELKKELSKVVKSPVDDLQESYINFLLNVYLIYGATSVGTFFKPKIETEKIVDNITNDFKDSYYELLENTRNIIRLIKTHESEFNSVIKTKDWMKIEVLLSANEKKDFDWKFFTNHPLIIDSIKNEIKDNSKFTKLLSKNIREFSENENIRIINKQYEELQKIIQDLTVKILKNPQSITKNLKKISKEWK